MDATLFHPETSIRRALILALGSYGPHALSPGEREPLIGKLLAAYTNDPDAGIHGAAEWTLRQWNEQAKLKAADTGLIKLKEHGGRRWLVNSQGQTFALIEGPVEFTMGSPPTEPDRDSNEESHRRLIPRRFAIAAKEVSVSQYQEFVRENPQFGLDRSYLDKYSPDPDGPMIARELVCRRRLLQLAEQAGRPARGPVVLPAQHKRGVRSGDDDPGRRSETQGLPPAHRGGMGVRLPGGGHHQPVSWSLPRSAARIMPVTQATAPSMHGQGEACYPTTWVCSTCWGTCMNGVMSATTVTGPRGTEHAQMI